MCENILNSFANDKHKYLLIVLPKGTIEFILKFNSYCLRLNPLTFVIRYFRPNYLSMVKPVLHP